MDSEQILNLTMQDNDADAATIREYLKVLLLTLVDEGEGFSSKRPFGNSDWEWELYAPLVKAGVIDGYFDEDDSLVDCDSRRGLEAIRKAIVEVL